MVTKKRTALWVTLGVLGFIIILLLGSLIFVEVSINNLYSSLDEKQAQVAEAFEARSKSINDLTGILKSKMSLDPEVFTALEKAEKELKSTKEVKALSDANLKVDKAIDNLIFVMLSKYPYLQLQEGFQDIAENIDTARNRIVMKSTDYNAIAKDYNYAIDNFPGDLLSNIFGHSIVDTFQIVDYKDITN